MTLTLWFNYCIQYQALKCHNIHEYLKFVEIGNILVLGNVENEKYFSILKFLKSSPCNRLGVHLPMVVTMFWQKFFILANFPYNEAMEFGKMKTRSMVIHDSWFIIIVAIISFELDQTFKISWILLISRMLSQFTNYVTTYNLNFWIWHLRFGSYGNTYWMHE